jgi:hypothetical protein
MAKQRAVTTEDEMFELVAALKVMRAYLSHEPIDGQLVTEEECHKAQRTVTVTLQECKRSIDEQAHRRFQEAIAQARRHLFEAAKVRH